MCSSDLPKQKGEPAGCTYQGCNQKHFLYKCPKFKDLSIPDRKKFVKQIGACLVCLNKGHAAAQCPRFEKLGGCKTDGCDGRHSYMLHETVGPTVNAVIKSPLLPAVDHMLMLQELKAVDHKQDLVPARVMWDGGANLTMITEAMSSKLKLACTGRETTISLANSKIGRAHV